MFEPQKRAGLIVRLQKAGMPTDTAMALAACVYPFTAKEVRRHGLADSLAWATGPEADSRKDIAAEVANGFLQGVVTRGLVEEYVGKWMR